MGGNKKGFHGPVALARLRSVSVLRGGGVWEEEIARILGISPSYLKKLAGPRGGRSPNRRVLEIAELAARGLKHCGGCDCDLPLSEFGVWADGRGQRCLACVRVRQRAKSGVVVYDCGAIIDLELAQVSYRVIGLLEYLEMVADGRWAALLASAPEYGTPAWERRRVRLVGGVRGVDLAAQAELNGISVDTLRLWRQRDNQRLSRLKHPEKSRAKYLANRERYIEQSRRWAAENNDRLREWRRLDRQANPAKYLAQEHRRRALKRGAYVEEVNRRKVFERDGWVCGICGDPVDRSARAPDPWAVSLDHVVPLARGGDHSYANTQCAHFWCNSVKGDRELDLRVA